MGKTFPWVALSLLVLLSGCASEPFPGGVGEVRGPLQSIELYATGPRPGELYPTGFREHFHASDGEIFVISYWRLPETIEHTCGLVLRTPGHSIHQESRYLFRTEATQWATGLALKLPQGEAAQPLEGLWSVEVSLDGRKVGERTFSFDPGNIRFRTDARFLILPGKQDFEVAAGDYMWLQQYGVRESAKAALAMLHLALRDELARRFSHVEMSSPKLGTEMGTVLLTPMLQMSPTPGIDARLDLEVMHAPSQTVRRFQWRTSAGHNYTGNAVTVNFGLIAVDLANQASSSPELLEFLRAMTQATPE